MRKIFTTFMTLVISAVMLTGCSALMKDVPPKPITIRLEESTLIANVPFVMKDGNMEEHLGDAAPYVRQHLMKTSENDEMVVLIFGVDFWCCL